MTRYSSHLTGSEILLEVDSHEEHEVSTLAGVDFKPSLEGRSRNTSKFVPTVPSTLVGLLVGFTDAGRPLITFSGNPSSAPVESRATVPLNAHHVGNQVVLIFEEADPTRPIILGVICDPDPTPSKELPIVAKVDDESLILTAEKEIVLRCGKASITLTRAGKVIIRGAYLLSRSSGVNRIKGGSVQIN